MLKSFSYLFCTVAFEVTLLKQLSVSEVSCTQKLPGASKHRQLCRVTLILSTLQVYASGYFG